MVKAVRSRTVPQRVWFIRLSGFLGGQDMIGKVTHVVD